VLFGASSPLNEVTSEKISYRKLSYCVGSYNHKIKGAPNRSIQPSLALKVEVHNGTQAENHRSDGS
jgi:hypothetical protein